MMQILKFTASATGLLSHYWDYFSLKGGLLSHCWDYLSPEGLFLSYFPDCLSPGLFVSRKRLSVPFLGLFVSRRRFFVPLLGLFVSRRRFFCPIAGIICLLKGDFCPIASITSPEKGFLAYCWDYLFRWRFFVPLLGLFVSRRLFVCHISWAFCLLKKAFCPIAGIIFLPKEVFLSQLLGLFVFPTAGVVVSKRRYFAHGWDYLSPEGGFLSQCRDFFVSKRGYFAHCFLSPEGDFFF